MSRSPPRAHDEGHWDDDAWASESDDEEFVAQVVSTPAEERAAPGRRRRNAAARRTASGAPGAGAPAWMPLPDHAPGEESEQESNDASRASASEAPASPTPAGDASAGEPDALVASWVEQRLHMSPHAPETAPRRTLVRGLEARIEDPMAVLEMYAEAPGPSRAALSTTSLDDSADEPLAHDPAAEAASRVSALSAPAFDPLATMGDGVFLGVGSAEPASPPVASPPAASPERPGRSALRARQASARAARTHAQLVQCLRAHDVQLGTLRTLAWKGVPSALRPVVWQLLLGYLPTSSAARRATLARKRAEYAEGVERAFARGTVGLDQAIWHQIYIDVPRTNPGIRLWQQAVTQRALERILYVWAIRHPVSGYVQGINDLATPLFEVFLSAYICEDPEEYELAQLPAHALAALEADTFWCLSWLLDGIQDNYIFAQPGIQRQIRRMGELVARIDAPLHAHLAEQGVEYVQFAFRWMNCLLMREMSVKSIIRIWDTYLAEGADAFSDFHPFVCAVLLHKWSAELQQMDFQSIIMFLQSLPTQDWSDEDAELLLSEAFMYKAMFGNTAHLH